MIRKTSYTGAFLLCLLINIALNFYLTIPGWILLLLRFVLGIPIWWFVGYMGAFLIYMLIRQLIWHFVGVLGSKAKDIPSPKNINPYSSKGYEPINKNRE